MIMAAISRLVGAWFAFLLPCYNTFKALSHRPLSEPELEKLAMFWCVVGALTAVEMTAEWLYSWFPFYWELKTLFLLFLSLPQTQGSTWIYKTYLEPYFSKNEADIDAGIAAAQTQTIAFMQSKLSVLWDALAALLNRTANARQGQPGQNGLPGRSTPPSPQPGSTPSAPGQSGQPAAVPWMDAARGLWSAYGPTVVGAIQRQVPRGAPTEAAAASTGAQPPSLGQSTAFTMTPGTNGLDPRKVPLPPSGMPTPVQPLDTPPPFPTPRHY